MTTTTTDEYDVFVVSKIKGLPEAIQNMVESRPLLKDSLQISVGNPNDIQNYDADVIVCDPPLCATVIQNQRLKKRSRILRQKTKEIQWIQSTFTGVEPLIAEIQNEPEQEELTYTITRTGGIIGPSMANYCLTWILAVERKLFEAKALQQQREWNHEQLSFRASSLNDLTFAILGLTADGLYIASTLKENFPKCTVIGYLHNVLDGSYDASSFPDVSYVSNKLDDILVRSDYIISMLPNNEGTTNLLSGLTLQISKKRSPVFINVGRGNIIDEPSLIRGLDDNWLAAVVLDVFAVEPLPQYSRLWDHPNVHITPHVAALSFPEDVAIVFCDNAESFLQEKTMKYLVEYNQVY
eukprot:CAMPEP_0185731308 /NCGR_PEP_ID=MMETSP1171-20130828/12532_1 /TAXON_ID=374046 /ORGANISM="Helicotheca tamensis, Strain CCMP826" /LENGTH=352 /DNA_ID=CAMNT_0028400545 /DNA_START=248 /DNA_END=1306 /DNA_ORIENTATION=-